MALGGCEVSRAAFMQIILLIEVVVVAWNCFSVVHKSFIMNGKVDYAPV